MATNRELKDEATRIAAELGITVDVERKNNAALTELVSDLRDRLASPRGQKVDAPDEDSAEPLPPVTASAVVPETAEPTKPPATADEPSTRRIARRMEPGAPIPERVIKPLPVRSGWVIAEGRSLHCARGMLHAGAELRAGDVSDAGFQRLQDTGCIVRAELAR